MYPLHWQQCNLPISSQVLLQNHLFPSCRLLTSTTTSPMVLQVKIHRKEDYSVAKTAMLKKKQFAATEEVENHREVKDFRASFLQPVKPTHAAAEEELPVPMAMPPRRVLLLVGILIPFLAFSLQLLMKARSPENLWTADQLARYNGTEEGLPILLSILGSVFDVTKGRSHYGPGGGYHHFAGRDASRAFVSGNFTGDGLTDSLKGFSSVEMKSVVDWRSFYIKSYKYVGKLVGRYYDKQGKSTKYLKGIEAKAARGAQLMEKQKIEEAKLPGCNSKWSQDEGGEVWCDTGYPRLVQRPLEIALTGKVSKRCVCFKEEELDQPGLEVYKDCESLSKVCKV